MDDTYTQDDVFDATARAMHDTTQEIKNRIQGILTRAKEQNDGSDEDVGYIAGLSDALDAIDHPEDY